MKLPSNEKIGLISTKTAIGNYSGKVSVKGTVKSYDNSMYLIDVSFITTDTSTALSTDNGADGKTYIPNANLLVDINGSPSALSVTPTTNGVTIADASSAASGDSITLSYFTCQKNDPLKDCQQIIASAKAGDQFTSTQGITFYKMAEAGKWFAANDSIGYMVDVPKDAFFYKASSYLFSINTKYIQSLISKEAAIYCYNATSKLSAITNQTTTVKGNTWTTVVEGTDTDGKKVTCTLDTTFSDHQDNMTLSSYIVSNDNTSSGTVTVNT